MDSGIRIGRILGIPIHLHPTWFLVFLLVVFGLWSHLATDYPAIGPAWRVAIALLTSGLLFGSIVMHELGHSVLALRHGVAVRSITLFIFGGVAVMDREPGSPRAELEIALAGPATSALLGGTFSWLSGWFEAGSIGTSTFQWLSALNLGVAVFNLLPGFPLDGGRVLRAFLWWRGRDVHEATRVAARVGQGIAYGLVALGLLVATRDLASGVWLAFIGWFVLTACQASQRQAAVELSLRGLVARDVMTPRVPTVDASLPVAAFARDHVLRGDRWAIVLQGGVPLGLVSRTDVKAVPPQRWDSTTVGEIATPLGQVVMATPDLPLTDVLRLFSERRANQIPVVEGAMILGAVTRQNLLQAIEIRGTR
jgi:Zn-dependent protease/predicted transcriptional regulator